MRHALLFGLLCSFSAALSGQNEFHLTGGYVIPHRPEMGRLVTGHAFGLGVSEWREPAGRWAHERGRWGIRQGVQLAYTHTGSDDLGEQVTALWMTRFPIRQHLSFELGVGPGWSSRSYRASGPTSFSLASPFNLALHLAVQQRVPLRAPFHPLVGLGFTHLSNGGLQQPNLGTNAVTVRLACRIGSPPTRYPEIVQPPGTFERVSMWQFGLRSGLRDIGLPGGPLHPITTLRGVWSWHAVRTGSGPLGRITAWSPLVAAQLTLNQGQRVAHPGEPRARWQPAVLVGVRSWVGRFGLQFAHGVILANASEELGAEHLDAALLWRVHPAWQLELGLRAFSLRAEHPAVGITWTPGSRAVLAEGR